MLVSESSTSFNFGSVWTLFGSLLKRFVVNLLMRGVANRKIPSISRSMEKYSILFHTKLGLKESFIISTGT